MNISMLFKMTRAAALLLFFFNIAGCGNIKDKNGPGSGKTGIDTASQMYYADADDNSMNAAISMAKNTIDEFDKALLSRDPSYTDFAIKKPYKTESGHEHMWIGSITLAEGKYRGVVNNDAESTKEVKYGDTVLVGRDEISDWMYLDNNVLRGGYTIREVRNKMNKEEQKKFDAETGFIIKD